MGWGLGGWGGGGRVCLTNTALRCSAGLCTACIDFVRHGMVWLGVAEGWRGMAWHFHPNISLLLLVRDATLWNSPWAESEGVAWLIT